MTIRPSALLCLLVASATAGCKPRANRSESQVMDDAPNEAPTGCDAYRDRLAELEFHASVSEYKQILEDPCLETARAGSLSLAGDPAKETLKPVLTTGERFEAWLKDVNAKRPGAPLSVDENPVFPPTAPRRISPERVVAEFTELLASLPEWMRDGLYSEALVEVTPEREAAFVEFGIRIARLNGNALRWLTIMQLDAIRDPTRSKRDVRGFLALATKGKALDEALTKFFHLPAPEQDELARALVGLCINTTGNAQDCAQRLKAAKDQGDVLSFKRQYWDVAYKTWQDFFTPTENVPHPPYKRDPRTGQVVVYVQSTGDPEFERFASEILAKAWSRADFPFRVEFAKRSDAPTVVFDKTKMPMVIRQLGVGIKLVWNPTLPRAAASNQQRLAHEFGHVIGFKDCYFEYYDAAANELVSYQLDTRNLMCSLPGRASDYQVAWLKSFYQ